MTTVRIEKIHHLSCGTMRPAGGRLLNRSPALVLTHCLLLETPIGPILVDTGVGLEDMADPRRLGPMRHILNLERKASDTAYQQVRRLGIKPEEVAHIIITHLDLDHAGGLPDFPSATIHLHEREFRAAMKPGSLREKERYRNCHWAHSPNWETHRERREMAWFGLDGVRPIAELADELVLLPLPGHTRGHAAVAVKGPEGWLLHAGDTYYHHGEMEARPWCSPGFRLFQRLLSHLDYGKAMAQQRKVHALVHGGEITVRVLCAHDPKEYEELSNEELAFPGAK